MRTLCRWARCAVPAFGLLLSAAAAAPPQTVFRCGPDGREYSQTPCRDGQRIDVADPRSAAQRGEARAVAASEARLADRLERERAAREKAAPPAVAARIGAPATAASGSASAPKPAKRKAKAKATAPRDPSLSEPVRLPSAVPAPR